MHRPRAAADRALPLRGTPEEEAVPWLLAETRRRMEAALEPIAVVPTRGTSSGEG